jgi:hypothetical protein
VRFGRFGDIIVHVVLGPWNVGLGGALQLVLWWWWLLWSFQHLMWVVSFKHEGNVVLYP